MNRKERTRVLVDGNRKMLSRMASEAEQHFAVAVVKEPAEELVMLKMREDAQRSLFYLGEALMTSCTVRIGSAHGYGLVLGEDRKKARDLAVVDAVYAAGGNELLLRGWDEALVEEQHRLDERARKLSEALLRTQIDFSTMEVQG